MKVVKKSAISHPVLQGLMVQELQVLTHTEHPNIVRVFDLLEDETNYYTVSEIVDGGELFQLILNQGRLSERQAVKIIH
jgi:calcium/calmodulin-dependent protein kinase I